MKNLNIYIVHPISGCTGEEVVKYYDDMIEVLKDFGYNTFSPMTGKRQMRTELEFKATGYDNCPITSNHAIIERDRWMVSKADVVFANLTKAGRVSIGSCFELAWAHDKGKHTVVVMEEKNIHRHAFVIESADIVFTTEEDALAYLKELIK
jgi:nucleoside 2-deoxyribosyltransferase